MFKYWEVWQDLLFPSSKSLICLSVFWHCPLRWHKHLRAKILAAYRNIFFYWKKCIKYQWDANYILCYSHLCFFLQNSVNMSETSKVNSDELVEAETQDLQGIVTPEMTLESASVSPSCESPVSQGRGTSPSSIEHTLERGISFCSIHFMFWSVWRYKMCPIWENSNQLILFVHSFYFE